MNILKRIYLSLILKFASPVKRGSLIKNKILKDTKIGSNFQVHQNVNFGSEPYLIEFGNDVRITSGVSFVTHDGGMWVLRNNGMLTDADLFGKIKIGNNVHVGINSIIMPNVNIGHNVVIGAGSIVTKNIPSNSIAAGVPARVLSSIDEYYSKYKSKVDVTKQLNSQDKKEYLLNKFDGEEKKHSEI